MIELVSGIELLRVVSSGRQTPPLKAERATTLKDAHVRCSIWIRNPWFRRVIRAGQAGPASEGIGHSQLRNRSPSPIGGRTGVDCKPPGRQSVTLGGRATSGWVKGPDPISSKPLSYGSQASARPVPYPADLWVT